jgi:hypothetical protein
MEAEWQAEADADALKRAAEVVKDKKRHKAALAKLKEQADKANEAMEKAKGLRR